MEHVFATELSLELVLCTAMVLGGCHFIRQRRGERPKILGQQMLGTDTQMEHPPSIIHSSDRSGHPMAVLTKPMLLARMEAESAAITSRMARETKLRSLTGLQDVGRLTEVMEQTLIPLMIKDLSPNGLSASGLISSYDQHLIASLGHTSSVVTTNLFEFAGRHTFMAVTGAFFGSTFPASSAFQDYSLLLQSMERLDAPLWRWMPSKRRVSSARDRLVKTFSLYLEEWWYADGLHTIPGISRLVEKLLRGAKEEELDLEEASCALLSFVVEAHLNLWTTTFCLLSQILSNPSTHRSVVEEVRRHCDYFSSRLLESATEEVLRWIPGQPSERHVKGDAVFIIDRVPHALKSGTKLLLNLSGVNFDEDVYEHPSRFTIDRIRNDCLPLPRPFGEGRHMCKGGHLAKLQIKSFVYHVFRTLDFQLNDSDTTAER